MERQDCLRVFTHDSGFMFVDDALVEVKFISTLFKFSHNENNYAWYDSETTVELPDGSQTVVKGYNTIFDSVKKWEQKEEAETSYKKLYGEYGSVIFDVLGRRYARGISYWVVENGKPMWKTMELREFKFMYKGNRFTSNEHIPEKRYVSREEAISYNDIKVIDKNGNTTLRTGINKFLQLDEDQQELIGQLENLLIEIRKQDIFLCMDCCERITAYNFRNVSGYVMNYNTELSDSEVDAGENPDDFEKADRYGEPFKVHGCIETWGDDNNLFIKRKKIDKSEKNIMRRKFIS